MDQICRVCMTSSVALVDIFADTGEPNLAYILGECVACHISSDDELPNKICLSCTCDAQAAFKFKRRCEESHQTLSEMLKQSKAQSEWTIKLELTEHNNPGRNQMDPENSTKSSSSTDEQGGNLHVKSELLTAEKWELAEENIDLGCVKVEGEDSLHSDEFVHNTQQEQSYNTEESVECMQQQEFEMPKQSCNIEPASKKNQYKCVHCPKLFTQSSHLNAHIRTHTGERPYKCPQCPKAFSQASNLRKHISLHSGERPFKCPHCTKSFTRQTDLQYHISTHPGERIYKCPQCTRYFIESSELDEHIRYHTGERTYKCEECSREFTYAWQLQRHIRTHTGEQPFQCTQCPKTCIDKGDLGRHMLSHTGQRPHKCPHCPKAFTRATYLKTHINTRCKKSP